MSSRITLGIIGDYDGRPSHLATEEAVKHAALKLGITIQCDWLPTAGFEHGMVNELYYYDGLWCAPGSPYKSMNGAINAIRFAREHNYPFLGTCGGFQHSVIEYGRNELHIDELQELSFNLYEPNDYITQLSCSLIGQTRQISLDRTSYLYDIYGEEVITEKYNCDFGLNQNFQSLLNNSGFRVVGTDEDKAARLMVIEKNDFFVASLFQPQLSSTYDKPHPLIIEYIKKLKLFSSNR